MKHFLLGVLLLQALTRPSGSGINLFSLEQDLLIGAASAREAGRTLTLVRDPDIEKYVREIGATLGGSSPSPRLRYTFHVVDTREANIETFPGGRVYIDRGLLEITTNEHEIAGLLAHEVAHAAARHGTRQLSGQLLVQGPGSMQGGLNTHEGWKEQLEKFGKYLGARETFLRYSRDQEIEANRIAVDILVKSPYSPYGLASILKRINRLDEPGDGREALPGYAFSHPQVEEAAAQLDAEIAKRRVPQRTLSADPAYTGFRATLSRLPVPKGGVDRGNPASDLPNEHIHPESYYRLKYPDGWQVSPVGANGATIAAPGGMAPTAAGNDLRTGILFDIFPMERQMTLDQATNRLLVFLRQRNQDLRPIAGAQTQMLMGSEPALRTVMIANSRPNQLVWVVTRQYYDNLFYLVCVAPEDNFSSLQPTFEQILRSVELR